MSKIALTGNASGTGTLTIASQNTNSNYTLTIPNATGTIITTAGGDAISGTTGTFSSTIQGGATISVGGATPSASGAGITFPATQSASTDANTLDDYEEGTFTATITGSSSGSGTPSASTKYIKIGQQVTVWCRFENITFPTYSGNLRVSLPFTPGSAAFFPRGTLAYYYPLANWDTLSNFVGFLPIVFQNNAFVEFSYKLVDGDWQNVLTAANTTTSNTGGLYLEFSVTYFTA